MIEGAGEARAEVDSAPAMWTSSSRAVGTSALVLLSPQARLTASASASQTRCPRHRRCQP